MPAAHSTRLDTFFTLLGHEQRQMHSNSPANRWVQVEQTVLCQIVSLGLAYSRLDAATYDAASCCRCMQVLTENIEECLHPYRAYVLDQEQHHLRSPECSLSSLRAMGEFQIMISCLLRLVASAWQQADDLAALDGRLRSTAIGCTYSIRAALRLHLRHMRRLLRFHLAAWLMHGEVVKGGIFFVQLVRPTRAPLLSPVALNSDERSTTVLTSRDGWFAYELAVTRKPQYMPAVVAESVLFVGKAVRVLRFVDRLIGARSHTTRTTCTLTQRSCPCLPACAEAFAIVFTCAAHHRVHSSHPNEEASRIRTIFFYASHCFCTHYANPRFARSFEAARCVRRKNVGRNPWDTLVYDGRHGRRRDAAGARECRRARRRKQSLISALLSHFCHRAGNRHSPRVRRVATSTKAAHKSRVATE